MKGLDHGGGRQGRTGLILVGLALLALACGLFGVSLGTLPVGGVTAFKILLARIVPLPADWSAAQEMAILHLRLPRVAMAGLVGASLALAGVALQALTRNPLADPSILGVSSGAAFGAVAGLHLAQAGRGGSRLLAPSLLAFAGALVATAVVYAASRARRRLSVTALVLSGVIVGLFFTSATMLLTAMAAPEEVQAIALWLMGNLGNADLPSVGLVGACLAAGLAIVLLQSARLNALALGEEAALQLGVEAERVKRLVFAGSALVTGAAVAVGGTIGFVGLIVPHAARFLLGADNRVIVPASALVGASLLILADVASRALLAPVEIPLGAVTAFGGAPFFLLLLRRQLAREAI